MYILHVIPIARGIHDDTIAYFSVREVLPGAYVRVRYNNRLLVALVVRVQPARDLKTDMKHTNFTMKNILEILPDGMIAPACVQGLADMAEYMHVSWYDIISQMIPQRFLEDAGNGEISFHIKNTITATETPPVLKKIDTNINDISLNIKNNTNVKNYSHNKHTSFTGVHEQMFQASRSERIDQYRILARQMLAQQKSLVIIAPTVHQVESIAKSVGKGIEHHMIMVHGSMTTKKLRTMWQRIHSATDDQNNSTNTRNETHSDLYSAVGTNILHYELHSATDTDQVHNNPLIIVVTPALFSTVIRADMGMCIVETCASPAFRSHKEPYIDMVDTIRRIGAHMNTPLILADTLLPFSMIRMVQDHRRESLIPLHFSFSSHATIKIYERLRKESFSQSQESKNGDSSSHKKEKKEEVQNNIPNISHIQNEEEIKKIENKKEPWRAVDTEMLDDMKNAVALGNKIVVFSPRKGLASSLTCQDCGYTSMCETCGSFLTLSRHGEAHMHCYYCRSRSAVSDRCVRCDGHRLALLGITTERIMEELHETFPALPITCIDSIHTTTDASVRTAYQAWSSAEGPAILVGTQRMMSYLDTMATHLYIPSLESLLARPEYDVEEHALRTIMTLIEDTLHIGIQTASPDHPVLRAVSMRRGGDMIEGQLRLREQFHYPPYGQYLAVGPITLPSDEVQKRMTAQRDIFESYDPQILNIAKPTNMLPKGLFITLKVPDEEILPRLALIEKIDLLRLPGYVVYGM